VTLFFHAPVFFLPSSRLNLQITFWPSPPPYWLPPSTHPPPFRFPGGIWTPRTVFPPPPIQLQITVICISAAISKVPPLVPRVSRGPPFSLPSIGLGTTLSMLYALTHSVPIPQVKRHASFGFFTPISHLIRSPGSNAPTAPVDLPLYTELLYLDFVVVFFSTISRRPPPSIFRRYVHWFPHTLGCSYPWSCSLVATKSIDVAWFSFRRSLVFPCLNNLHFFGLLHVFGGLCFSEF